MRRVIIESPFAGDVARNILYARCALLHSLDLGEAPIASHLLYPFVLDDRLADARQHGIDAGLAWRSVAEYAVFYTNLGMSRGMEAALLLYQKEGMPYRERLIGWSELRRLTARIRKVPNVLG